MFDLSKDDREKGIEIIRKFIKSFVKNEKSENKEEIDKWLQNEMKTEFKDATDEELKEKSKGILLGINRYYECKAKVLEKRRKGKSNSNIIADEVVDIIAKEIMEETDIREVHKGMKDVTESMSEVLEADMYDLAYKEIPGTTLRTLNEKAIATNDNELKLSVEKTMTKASSLMGINTVNKYTGNINVVFDNAMNEVDKAVFTKSGAVSQNPNLDGFLFEEAHAGSFNIDAAIKDKNYQAKALKPDIYGKNSIDIVINEGNQIVKKYQAKAYSTWEKTSEAFKGYVFQRKLAPEGQAENIKNATTVIEHNGIKSKSITKSEIKDIQNDVQETNSTKSMESFFRKNMNTVSMAKQIGEITMRSAAVGFAASTVMNMTTKAAQGEDIDAEEVIVSGLQSGAQAGLAASVAGGLHVFGKKVGGKIGEIFKNTPVVGVIAASSVDIIGTALSLGKGEIGLGEAATDVSASLTGAWIAVASCTAIMAAKGGVLGTVGNVIGGVIGTILGGGPAGGVVGSVIGGAIGIGVSLGVSAISSHVGNTVKTAIKSGLNGIVRPVVNAVKTAVSAGYQVVKSVASGAVNAVKSVGRAIGSVASGIGSAIGGLFGR